MEAGDRTVDSCYVLVLGVGLVCPGMLPCGGSALSVLPGVVSRGQQVLSRPVAWSSIDAGGLCLPAWHLQGHPDELPGCLPVWSVTPPSVGCVSGGGCVSRQPDIPLQTHDAVAVFCVEPSCIYRDPICATAVVVCTGVAVPAPVECSRSPVTPVGCEDRFLLCAGRIP